MSETLDSKSDQKCCLCVSAKPGLIATLLLNALILFAGTKSLMAGDPASLYGAPQKEIDRITKDMDKEGDEYKLWVFMQSEIWWGYLILTIINVACIVRWILKDTYMTRLTVAITNGTLALWSLWNVIMGLAGFHYTPPEVFMLALFTHFTYVAYRYANELKEDLPDE